MNNFLTHIKPQVNEIISELFSKGYCPGDLEITQPLYWDQLIPFNAVKLHFENADISLTKWLNAAEALTGSDNELNLALIELFTEDITTQWAARMEALIADGFEQLELNAEHEGADAA